MNAIRVMVVLFLLLFCAPAVASPLEPYPDDPSLTSVVGRVTQAKDGTYVLDAGRGGRLTLTGYVFKHVPIVVGAAGLVSSETHTMDVKEVRWILYDEHVRGLEEVHAAMIDIALDELRKGHRDGLLRQALEQAAVVIELKSGPCKLIVRCREERALAARVADGTVDLRTLPSVLKVYRADPLSLRS